jgi:hypothetical protein
MANLRAIRTRIKSVENTQQITKSMKMVAAAKLRRTQTAFSAQKAWGTSPRVHPGEATPAPPSRTWSGARERAANNRTNKKRFIHSSIYILWQADGIFLNFVTQFLWIYSRISCRTR